LKNLTLLPEVSRAIAQTEGYAGVELEQKLSNIQVVIFNSLSSQTAIDDVVTRYCRRRIDRVLKEVDLSDTKTINEIISEYATQTSALDINSIAAVANQKILSVLENRDLSTLLTIYENKELLALAAQLLKQQRFCL